MLIQKTARQSTAWTKAPPRTGPRAMLTPTVAPHTPIARARSRGSPKVFRMIDMATGFSIDPPTPWSILNTTSRTRLGASEQSSEPSVNSTSPTWNTSLRPIRSAVEPDSISRLASTSV